MGIRTLGFEKVPRSSNSVGEDRTRKQKTGKEASNVVEKGESGESEEQSAPPVAKPPEVDTKSGETDFVRIDSDKVIVKVEKSKGESRTPTKIKSPSKKIGSRTPTSMARLSGMKATRKLKRHRKRSLYVQSVSKILRSSIRTNKTRQATAATRQQPEGRQKEKSQTKEPGTLQSNRITTRMLIRRSSREEVPVPEDPLRTVELIKRPLELREPATKLLFLASLGLYPHTGESDMTPIVVVREVIASPGKKNGVRKSLELPLIPYHKRLMDLSHQDKRSSSDNPKSKAQASKSGLPLQNQEPSSQQKQPATNENQSRPRKKSPSPKSDGRAMSTIISNSQAINAVNSITVTEVIRKVPAVSTSTSIETRNLNQNTIMATVSRHSSDLTITPSSKPVLLSTSNANQTACMPSLSSKSLLKTNLTATTIRPPPPLHIPINTKASAQSLPIGISFVNSSTKVEVNHSRSSNSNPAMTAFLGSEELERVMQNITIFPATSRKRSLSPPQMDQNTMSIRPVGGETTTLCGGNVTISIPSVNRKQPPKKKQKISNDIQVSHASMSPLSSLSGVSVSTTSQIQVSSVTQQQVIEGEALNLCMKRRTESLSIPALSQSPPKLQYKSEPKVQVNGSKPLNLIIPRPPPLTKAPLEVTNIPNYSQNQAPRMGFKGKSVQAKKPKKLRQQNHNHINMNHCNQAQLLHHSLPPLPLLTAETAVHAKSLLKCMNGEENACREVGESLDSVKTMLARLQTSIGPAVNGVRLITIE